MVRARRLLCCGWLALGTAGILMAAPASVLAGEPGAPGAPSRPRPPGDRVEREERRFEESTWLGLQLTPVPAAVAAQLPLEGHGLMVRNVFKDGPADRAGIERYDVIAQADGERVPGNVEAFSGHVRGNQPGEVMRLGIFRKGQQSELDVRLERAPDRAARPELKYEEDDPDVLRMRNFGLRGRILRPGEDGGWVMEDLGNLPGVDRMLWLWGDEDEGAHGDAQGRVVEKDGSVLTARMLKDGSIEVRRFKKGEDEEKAEVTTYRTMEDLKAADPKAHALLEKMERPQRRPFRGPWAMTRPAPPGPEAERRWLEWRDRLRRPWERPGPGREVMPAPAPPVAPAPPAPPVAPANVRFDVDDEGRISVQVRRDDAEMNMTFRNREAFQERAPELYKQFEAMERQVR